MLEFYSLLFTVFSCVYFINTIMKHGITPAYLGNLCIPITAISGSQHLRSAAMALYWFHDPGLQLDKSFAVNGLATWNRFPPALRSLDLSERAFKQALKTHLFSATRRH